MDNITCTLCKQQFDSEMRIPRVKTDCGDSFCEECITMQLQKMETFICPKDKMPYVDKRDISMFPRNETLIKQLQSQSKQSLNQLKKQSQAVSINDNNLILKQIGAITTDSISTSSPYSQIRTEFETPNTQNNSFANQQMGQTQNYLQQQQQQYQIPNQQQSQSKMMSAARQNFENSEYSVDSGKLNQIIQNQQEQSYNNDNNDEDLLYRISDFPNFLNNQNNLLNKSGSGNLLLANSQNKHNQHSEENLLQYDQFSQSSQLYLNNSPDKFELSSIQKSNNNNSIQDSNALFTSSNKKAIPVNRDHQLNAQQPQPNTSFHSYNVQFQDNYDSNKHLELNNAKNKQIKLQKVMQDEDNYDQGGQYNNDLAQKSEANRQGGLLLEQQEIPFQQKQEEGQEEDQDKSPQFTSINAFENNYLINGNKINNGYSNRVQKKDNKDKISSYTIQFNNTNDSNNISAGSIIPQEEKPPSNQVIFSLEQFKKLQNPELGSNCNSNNTTQAASSANNFNFNKANQEVTNKPQFNFQTQQQQKSKPNNNIDNISYDYQPQQQQSQQIQILQQQPSQYQQFQQANTLLQKPLYQPDNKTQPIANTAKQQDDENQPSQSNFSSFLSQQNANQYQLCTQHNKLLSIVCFTCMTKVCTQCTTKEEHTGHYIEQEFEAKAKLSQQSIFIKNLQEKLEKMQEKLNINVNSVFKQDIEKIIQEKQADLKKNIDEKFQEAFRKLEMKQKQMNQEASQSLLKLQERILRFQMMPKQQLINSYLDWKFKIQQDLQSLESRQKENYLDLTLFEVYQSIIAKGEKIQLTFDNILNFPKQLTQNCLTKIQINFNTEIATAIQQCCQLSSIAKQDETTLINNSIAQLSQICFDQLSKYDHITPKSKNINKKAFYLTNVTFDSIQEVLTQIETMSQEVRQSFIPAYQAKEQGGQIIKDQVAQQQSFKVPQSPQGVTSLNNRLILINNKQQQQQQEQKVIIPQQQPKSPRTSNISVINQRSKTPNPQSSNTFTQISTKVNNAPENSSQHQQAEKFSFMPSKQNQLKRENPSINKQMQIQSFHQQAQQPQQQQNVTPQNKQSIVPPIKIDQRQRPSNANFKKVSEKMKKIIEKLNNPQENLEQIDLTAEDLEDFQIQQLSNALKSTESKVQKIILTKNKISDNGFLSIVKALQNNVSVHTLNLTQNICTEKSLDYILGYLQDNQILKNIYLSKNASQLQKFHQKIEDIKNMGINIFVQ